VPTAIEHGIELVSIGELDPAAIDEAYSRLLEPNFPPAELIDRAAFSACYCQALPAFPGIVALHNGVPVGAAFGERHESTGIVLLGYLVVLAERRDLHIGSRLLARATTEWSAVPRTTAVLAEIEDPRHHEDEGMGDPTARLRFYARADARVVPIDYFQPSLRPGLPRVPGMLLLSLVPERRSLAAAPLMEFLDDYLTGCEGPLSADDAEYAALRAAVLRGGPTLPLAPLSDLLWPTRHPEQRWTPLRPTSTMSRMLDPSTPADPTRDEDERWAAAIRAGDPAAVEEVVARDYGVSALFAEVATEDPGAVLDAAWRAHVQAIGDGSRRGDLRRELLRAIWAVRPDGPTTPRAQLPTMAELGTFAPDGDRWAGWWDKEPPPWPDGFVPSTADVVTALRRLPLGVRAVLVLRDVAGLAAPDSADVLDNDHLGQPALLEQARDAFLVELDREVVGVGRGH
jgi:hypothetical protein